MTNGNNGSNSHVDTNDPQTKAGIMAQMVSLLSPEDRSEFLSICGAVDKLCDITPNVEIADDPTPPAANLVDQVLAMTGTNADGQLFAASVRSWVTRVASAIDGQGATDHRGWYVLILGVVEGSEDLVLCKRINDSGMIYGQTITRNIGQLKLLGLPSNGDVWVKVRKARKVAAPETKAAPESDEPSTPSLADGIVDPATVDVPSGATYMIVCDANGLEQSFANGGQYRLLITGKKGQLMLKGDHRIWSSKFAAGTHGVKFE